MHGPPYLVDLFVSVFHSLEPGIDNAISRSNDDFYSFLNISSSKFNHLTNHANWASTTNFIIHFSDILFRLSRPRTEILNDGLDLYCLGKNQQKINNSAIFSNHWLSILRYQFKPKISISIAGDLCGRIYNQYLSIIQRWDAILKCKIYSHVRIRAQKWPKSLFYHRKN